MQPRSSFSASFLPFALLLLVSHCAAQVTSPTQCTGPAAGKGFNWWLTKNTSNPMNPCQVYQKLMRYCQPSYNLPLMGSSVFDDVDICDEDVYGYSSRCCCSTEAYALRQACWSCQNDGRECPDGRGRPTLREYIKCDRNLKDWGRIYSQINMPTWARFGIPLDAVWSIEIAKQVTKTPLNMVAQGDPDVQEFDPDHGVDKPIIVASVTGSLFGLLFVAGIAACAFLVRRRRHQTKTRHSRAPPRWFMQNVAYDGGSAGSTAESHTMVESASIPPKPPPSLGRGRIGSHPNASTASGGSWWSSFAREPYLPRAGNTLESRDYARNYSASRSEVTVSMIRSETEDSRISLDSDHTIESFSNSPHRQSTIASRAASRVTHAFSV